MITETGCSGALHSVGRLGKPWSIFCNQLPSLASKTTWPASVALSCDQGVPPHCKKLFAIATNYASQMNVSCDKDQKVCFIDRKDCCSNKKTVTLRGYRIYASQVTDYFLQCKAEQ
jgi:hypothetical protein